MIIGQFLQFGIGGADKTAENIVRGLISLGHKPILFYNEWSHPKISSQWDSGTVMLSRFNNYSDLNLIEINDISKLNDFNLDILNTHRSGDDFWAIPNFENTDFKFKIIETNFHGNCGTKADHRVFPSFSMIKKKKIKGDFSVIPNAIMPPLTFGDLREELNIKNKFIFGRIGRACEEIYSSICLEAYKKIENDRTFFVYMSPCKKARLDAEKFGIKNIIFLEQSVDNIYVSKVYNTFDVFCHSNKLGETFGNTIAEAMIHGKPVVSHVGSGNWSQAQKELLDITPEVFVESDILNRYRDIMKKLFEDRDFYTKIATAQKNKADFNYNYIEVSKKYYEVYERILVGKNA